MKIEAEKPDAVVELLVAKPEQAVCCVMGEEQSTNTLCDLVWQVWQEHSQVLRDFLQQRTREQALTDDMLSDVMLKVYKNCERLAEVKDVRAWLVRIAQNTLIDHYRKSKPTSLLTAEALEEAPENEMLPEQRLAACLGEMLSLLPEGDRLPLQWADLQGLPQEEVARRLGMSLSGAKSRIQRARVKLKQQIEACCKVETDAQGRIADFIPKKNSEKSC